MVVVRKVKGKKSFKDWRDLNDNWGKAVERNMDRGNAIGLMEIPMKESFIIT